MNRKELEAQQAARGVERPAAFERAVSPGACPHLGGPPPGGMPGSDVGSCWEDVGCIVVAAGRLVRRLGRGVTTAPGSGREPPAARPAPQPSPAVPGDDGTSPPAVCLDRRTLSRYAVCCFQGFAVETGLVSAGSPAADAGREVHQVIAEGIRRYAAGGLAVGAFMERAILQSRPDVQHEAAEGLRRSVWALERFLLSLHPDDLLGFRGGSGGRSGRIWREVLPAGAGRGPVLAVSQLDLLHAGPSASEVHEIDFMTGRKAWTATDVRRSFRFRLNAWLAFGWFAGLELYHVRVWNTRANALTPAVTFTRRDASSAGWLVRGTVQRRQSALAALGQVRGADQDRAIARGFKADPQRYWWGGLEECSRCPACLKCPAAVEPVRDFAADPEIYVRDTAAMKAALGKRMGVLRAAVRDAGDDLVFDGLAFGTGQPGRPMNREPSFYQPAGAKG